MTVAPPLSARVTTMSSLFDKSFSALRSPFVRLRARIACLSWFLMSSMTADSKVVIVVSTFCGVNELFRSFKLCNMVGLYSEILKCALSLTCLKNALRPLLNMEVLYLGGRGQKFKLLSNKLNTSTEKVCLIKFTMRPFGSFCSLQVS